MKKNYSIIYFFLFVLTFTGCHTNDIDESVDDTTIDDRILTVTMNVDDPELFKVTTAEEDTITFYGNKNASGIAQSLDIIEIKQKENGLTLFHLDENGRPVSIRCSNNVQIDFEWIEEFKAVVKAHDYNSNTYLTTIWDVNEDKTASIKANSISNYINERTGKLSLDFESIIPDSRELNITTKSIDNTLQTCLLTINRCNEPYNASAWIDVYDARTDKFLTKLYNRDVVSTGNYLYVLPTSTYPTASNSDLCDKIDFLIKVGAVGTQWLVSGGLQMTLTFASTLVGEPVAAITAACTVIAGAAHLILTTLDMTGGTSEIMKTFNPEWYYKSYINADLTLYPIVDALPIYIYGIPQTVSPENKNIYLTVNIEGIPAISSFELIPSYPHEGQDYQAIARFDCIPYGSEILISIIGTDGYSDSITKKIPSSSGQAILYVPGAEAGVYDVCTVIITTPENKIIEMQASLVFGN